MAEAPSIAIVGAAGFVGRELLDSLRDAGITGTAVVRGLPELSGAGDFHSVFQPGAGASGVRFDVVVNLAYPNSGPAWAYPEQNKAIFRTVDELLAEHGRVIHVSTQAVFGSALDRPVTTGHVGRHRDDPYVEVKIDAEHHFEKRRSVDIVRLGNVWGRGSGSWATPLVQRLVTGRPVGIAGSDGFSNATDVANVASYLTHLIAANPGSGVRYHHLAEFSAVRWSEWIEPAARELGVEAVYGDPALLQPATTSPFAEIGPRGIYRSLRTGRASGSWMRSAVRSLPGGLRNRLKGETLVYAPGVTVDRSEQTYLAIMSTRHEFASQVDADWSPPVSKEESLDRFLVWLRGR